MTLGFLKWNLFAALFQMVISLELGYAPNHVNTPGRRIDPDTRFDIYKFAGDTRPYDYPDPNHALYVQRERHYRKDRLRPNPLEKIHKQHKRLYSLYNSEYPHQNVELRKSTRSRHPVGFTTRVPELDHVPYHSNQLKYDEKYNNRFPVGFPTTRPRHYDMKTPTFLYPPTTPVQDIGLIRDKYNRHGPHKDPKRPIILQPVIQYVIQVGKGNEFDKQGTPHNSVQSENIVQSAAETPTISNYPPPTIHYQSDYKKGHSDYKNLHHFLGDKMKDDGGVLEGRRSSSFGNFLAKNIIRHGERLGEKINDPLNPYQAETIGQLKSKFDAKVDDPKVTLKLDETSNLQSLYTPGESVRSYSSIRYGQGYTSNSNSALAKTIADSLSVAKKRPGSILKKEPAPPGDDIFKEAASNPLIKEMIDSVLQPVPLPDTLDEPIAPKSPNNLTSPFSNEAFTIFSHLSDQIINDISSDRSVPRKQKRGEKSKSKLDDHIEGMIASSSSSSHSFTHKKMENSKPNKSNNVFASYTDQPFSNGMKSSGPPMDSNIYDAIATILKHDH